MTTIKRGATPVYVYRLPQSYPIEQIKQVTITYVQLGKVVLTKTKEDMVLKPGVALVRFSRKDTMAFRPNKPIHVQGVVEFRSGATVTGVIRRIEVQDILGERSFE